MYLKTIFTHLSKEKKCMNECMIEINILQVTNVAKNTTTVLLTYKKNHFIEFQFILIRMPQVGT